MTDTTPVKKLVVPNENNKLACQIFTVIHFAPPDAVMINEPLIGNRYVVETDDGSRIVELVHFERMPVIHLDSFHTIAACGCTVDVWRKNFHEKYANTNHETKIAIYCYMYVKDDDKKM